MTPAPRGPQRQQRSPSAVRAFVVEPIYDENGRLRGTLCGASRDSTPLTAAHSASIRLFGRLIGEKLRTAGTDDLPADASAPQEHPRARQAAQGSPAPGTGAVRLQRRREAALRACRLHVADAHVRGADLHSEDARDGLLARADRELHQYRQARMSEPHADASDLRTRVMVADDDALTRFLVATVIETNPALRLVAEAATGAETVGVAVAEQPDLIVLDFELGDASAESVVTALRAFAPGTRVLLYSGNPHVHRLGQRLGADRTVSKQDGPERLLESLQALIATLG